MAATPEGYMPGFGNDFETEALPGALPVGQNSPQRCAYGLYAEQLVRLAFHSAAREERALVAVSDAAFGAAREPLQERCRSVLEDRACAS